MENVGMTPNDGGGWDGWNTDAGGVIIRQVHVYNGDDCLGQWNDLPWQSPDINTDTEPPLSVQFKNPQSFVNRGVGISVRVWFKNQYYIKGGSYGAEDAPAPGHVLPFSGPGPVVVPKQVTTKRAWLVSVGCVILLP